MVMSMWNTLAQGHAVKFEMRWKPQSDNMDNGKWTLASCVPIFDDDEVLISIAGNVIDIDAQIKSQEATQARIEALEQAKLSELKFERFAQLSPTAIFIFVPETGKLQGKLPRCHLWMLQYQLTTGMQFVNDQFYELTGLSHAPNDQFEWLDLIAEEDLKNVEADWVGMLKGKRSDGVQFRLKKTWVDQDGVRENIWVQSSSYPQLDEHGAVLSTACL
jgi:PAS domain-containing protein